MDPQEMAARMRVAEATAARAREVAATLIGLTADHAGQAVAAVDGVHLQLFPPDTPLLTDYQAGRICAYVEHDRVIDVFTG